MDINNLVEQSINSGDAEKTQILYEYFLSEPFFHITESSVNYKNMLLGQDAIEHAAVWANEVKPFCEHINSVYRPVFETDINAMENYEEKQRFADEMQKFDGIFKTQVFHMSDKYEERINAFNHPDTGMPFKMPRLLKQCRDTLDRVANGAERTRIKFLKDPSSLIAAQVYEIKVLLNWLNIIGDNEHLVDSWEKEFNELNKEWHQLLEDASENTEYAIKAEMPNDHYENVDGNDLRRMIKESIDKEFSVDVAEVLLQSSDKSKGLKRFNTNGVDFIGITYSAAPFIVTVPQGNNILSLHRGRIEKVNSSIDVILLAEDENFSSPRGDQTRSIDTLLSGEEKRKQKSEEKTVEISEERVKTKAAIASEVEAAKKAAMAEAERIRKETEDMIAKAQQNLK